MSVTVYDGQYSFRQNELATKGIEHGAHKMSAEQAKKFEASPFMAKARQQEDYTSRLSGERDKMRKERDKEFQPNDEDFTAPKAFDYDKGVNYYTVLGVDEYASLEEIKKSYKKLSLLYHPDKTAGLIKEEQEERAAIFIELKNAYLVLGDQATRRQYDRDRDFMVAGSEVNGYKQRKDRVPFDATEVMKKIQEHYKPPGKEIEVDMLCKLEKFFYGGAKQFTRTRRVIREGQEEYDEKQFRLDVPKGAEEPWECKMKGGDMHHDTQADTLRFVVQSKPHKTVERHGSDLRVLKPVRLRPDAHLQAFLSTEVHTVAGRSLLLWGRNPLHGQGAASNAVLNVSIQGEGLGETGRLLFSARRDAQDGQGVISVTTTYTKMKFFVGVCAPMAVHDLKAAVREVLEWPDDQPVDVTRSSGESFAGDEEILGPADRSVVLNCKAMRTCEVPMGLRRARDLLGAVTAFASSERFLEALEQCERKAGSPQHEQLLRQLWEPACHSALICGYDISLEGLRLAVQRALWVLREEPDAAVLQRRFEEFGFRQRQPPAARFPRRRKLPRPEVENFLLRNGLGPTRWQESEANLPDPGSETEPEHETPGYAERRALEQREAEEDRKDLETFLLHGGSGKSESSWSRRAGPFGAAAHPMMLKRAERRAQVTPECSLELTPLFGYGESMQLFTKPTCFLHFYSNLHQAYTDTPNTLPPSPVFAVAICCPTGAKRAGREEWMRLRHSLMPMLKQAPVLLLRQARSLLPKALLAEPAFRESSSYQVTEGVSVARAGEELETPDDVEAEEGSDGEEESNAEIIRLAKLRVEEARGEACDFDDLDDLDDLEEAVHAVRRERREQRRRLRASREAWQREARLAARRESQAAVSSSGGDAEQEVSPMLWKQLAAAAFTSGDYYLAQLYYSKEAAGYGSLPLLQTSAENQEQEDATISNYTHGGSTSSDDRSLAVAFSNRSHCFARLQHFDAALQDGRRATSLRPDWARAWSRVGAAAPRGSSEAVEAWRRAVELEPSGEHVKGLEEACRNFNQAGSAHSSKERGNEALRVQEFSKAVAHFTEAIAAIPVQNSSGGSKDEYSLLRSILFSNRSCAFLRLRHWNAAVSDAEKSVAEGQSYPKGYCRLGVALLACQEHERAYAIFAAALKLDERSHAASKGRQACLQLLPRWASPTSRRRQLRFSRDLYRPLGTSKVFVVPELFFDRGSNEAWAHGIHNTKFLDDILILPGNVANSLRALERALKTLKNKFRRVFFIPGNQEMWITNVETDKYSDSLCKLWAILDLCDQLGVDTCPAAISEGVYVVPLLSWYNAEFDVTDPFPDTQFQHDKYAKWPMDAHHQVWRFMLALNRAHVEKPYHGTVITCSHFVPRSELPVSREYGGAKVSGCTELDDQLRDAKSTCHVYGHTHKRFTKELDGVVYINTPHQGGGLEEPITCIFNGQNVVCEMVSVH
eukprot:TRINITY_DN3694_c0_g1_i1.p1 TRINITY_DN3694_c0_g1~~TRINITY_DN3694_c0_g1_i1.p1  ORF type:complete len:1450 (+),score=323.95 TRINITY_DN3694_c0_g1_i1:32-4381(+)